MRRLSFHLRFMLSWTETLRRGGSKLGRAPKEFQFEEVLGDSRRHLNHQTNKTQTNPLHVVQESLSDLWLNKQTDHLLTS